MKRDNPPKPYSSGETEQPNAWKGSFGGVRFCGRRRLSGICKIRESGMATWQDKVYAWVMNEKWAFLAALCAAVVAYGAALFNFSLSVDEENALVYGTFATNIVLGRWGLAFLQSSIFPAQFTPFFTAFFSLFFLSIAACFMSAALRLRGAEKLFFCACFASFPQFAFQMVFSVQSDCVAFGYALAAASVLAFRRFEEGGDKRFFLCSCLLYTFATGIYQSLFLVPPMLYALVMLGRLLPAPAEAAVVPAHADAPPLSGEFLRAAVFAGLAMTSLVLYFFISFVTTRLTGFQDTGYLTLQIGWGNFPVHRVVLFQVKAILGNWLGRAFHGEILFVAVWIPFLFIAAYFWRKTSGVLRVWALILLGLLPLLPFAQNLGLGQEQAPRTYLALGVLFAGLWALSCRVVSWHRLTLLTLAVIFTLVSSAHISRLFFLSELNYEADKLLANRIVTRLYQENPDFCATRDKLYIHGRPETASPPRGLDVFGVRFFTLDEGNMVRSNALMRILGMGTFRMPSANEVRGILDKVAVMPVWPQGGSVAMVDGIMVVKMGQKAGYLAP